MLPWILKIKLNKKTAIAFFALVVVFCFLIPHVSVSNVLAQDTDTFGVAPIDQDILLTNTDIRVVVVKIINTILGLLGLIALSLILYAGFVIMTSGGQEDKIAQARKTLINAVIGLVIILSAWAIVRFVFNALTGGFNEPGGERPPVMATFSGSGALGRVVKDHYPFRDATDVARNTSIVVTFGLAIDPASIAINTNGTCWGGDNNPTDVCGEGSVPYFGDCFDTNNDGAISWSNECDQLNTSTIKIDLADRVDTSLEQDDDAGLAAAVVASYEGAGGPNDKNVFTVVFKPLEYLGSQTEKQLYTVDLRYEIYKKGLGESIFDGQFVPKYHWSFETGTGLDLSPPHVESVYPDQGGEVAKNTIVQINFDEAVDPTTVQGLVSQQGVFENILLNTQIGGVDTSVTGTWKITNGYKTVEFISDEPCGLNSCGEMMYCLPVDCSGTGVDTCVKGYAALVRTAEWTQNAEAPFEAQPFSGVYDLAFNGLDNVNDNTGFDEVLNKPAGAAYTGKVINSGETNPDNYWWNFNVKNEIDRSTPYVESTKPGVDAQEIDGEASLEIGFSKVMGLSTMNDILLTEYPVHVCANAAVGDVRPEDVVCEMSERLDDIWFSTGAKMLNNKTTSYTKHRTFGPNGIDLYYFPSVPSTVKSANQNCVYPGRGPWDGDSALPGQASECSVAFDSNGTILSTTGCVGVTTVSSTDTGCVYTGVTVTDQNDSDMLKSDVGECINILRNEDISPTRYQGL